jgi:hypothetical protein
MHARACALIYEYQINVEHAPAFRDMRDFYLRARLDSTGIMHGGFIRTTLPLAAVENGDDNGGER